ncbi:hypothetical protein CDAR_84281 [Caerostris darwini]|uniref:Uncharacterized protein n=1 Tax=Caerostris darwini TaxID=1538125 RepID=A0AAV4WZ67_9ARAC|nr:hypothetical protein CDAR_84281 [Caerostris darwini]
MKPTHVKFAWCTLRYWTTTRKRPNRMGRCTIFFFFTFPLSGNELPIMAPSIYRVVLAKRVFATPQQNDTVSIDDINDVIKTSVPFTCNLPREAFKTASCGGGKQAEKKNQEEH